MRMSTGSLTSPAAAYPTLGEAARPLGINQPTWVIPVKRLETDLCHSLFERAERGSAMKLTAFGKESLPRPGISRDRPVAGHYSPRREKGHDGAEQEGVPAYNR
ncbi:LysR family transcriptional regulator [Streptomyces sp. NPDC088551]|uniref:helix-turn-helix domain-containing protein n=1 Tax=unclassified Streptomyces TaxID=2593676 RepID=UPI0037F2CEFF